MNEKEMVDAIRDIVSKYATKIPPFEDTHDWQEKAYGAGYDAFVGIMKLLKVEPTEDDWATKAADKILKMFWTENNYATHENIAKVIREHALLIKESTSVRKWSFLLVCRAHRLGCPIPWGCQTFPSFASVSFLSISRPQRRNCSASRSHLQLAS